MKEVVSCSPYMMGKKEITVDGEEVDGKEVDLAWEASRLNRSAGTGEEELWATF